MIQAEIAVFEIMLLDALSLVDPKTHSLCVQFEEGILLRIQKSGVFVLHGGGVEQLSHLTRRGVDVFCKQWAPRIQRLRLGSMYKNELPVL